MALQTQRATAGVIEEPIITAPIHKRVILHSASKISPEKRTYPQKIAASTYGQVFGVIVSILSVGKMLFDFNFDRDGSFLDKYLIPALGAITGVVLAVNSGKPKAAVTDIKPDSQETALNMAFSPRILTHENVACISGTTSDATVDELEENSPFSRPALSIVVGDESVQRSEDECLLERVYDELGFNFKTIPNDEKTLYLRYWFAKAYLTLERGSTKENNCYARAINLIDEIILSNDLQDMVLRARPEKIKLTTQGIVLPEEDLNLETFKRIFGITLYSISLGRKKMPKFVQLFNLLRNDQKNQLEALFYSTYFPQQAIAAK